MFASSISGIRNSISMMENAAIEASKGPKGDIVKSQVDMIVAENSLSANIAAIRTANDMHKSIIDMIA